MWVSNMKPELTLWQLFPKAKNFFVTRKRCPCISWAEVRVLGSPCLLCFLIVLTHYKRENNEPEGSSKHLSTACVS